MLTKYLISYGHMPIIKTIFTTLTFVLLLFENISDPNQMIPKSTDPDLYCFHHSYSIIGRIETSQFILKSTWSDHTPPFSFWWIISYNKNGIVHLAFKGVTDRNF